VCHRRRDLWVLAAAGRRYRGDAVRDFRGAMAGRGDKGLLITTGSFTADAMTQAPVTADERGELRSLAEAMDLPTGPLAGLNVRG